MARQSLLWSLGISGTKPIVAVQLDDMDHLQIVSDILTAQNFWLEKGISVDVALIHTLPTTYLQQQAGTIEDMIAKAEAGRSFHAGVEAESIFVLKQDMVPQEVVKALLSVAVIVLSTSINTLEQLVTDMDTNVAPVQRPVRVRRPVAKAPEREVSDLQFFNGFGGFSEDGRSYVIHHRGDDALPAPWINVIANPMFGTHCSAEGGGYTWYNNSREQQITPWSNDAVGDPPSEMVYVHDQVTNTVSSPTLLPLGRRDGSFTTRHGFGFSRHEALENDLALSLTITVCPKDPVKHSRIRIENRSTVARVLRLTVYADLVLGQRRSASARHVTSERDMTSGAVFLQNRFNSDFGDRVIFMDLAGRAVAATTDRHFVLGYKGVPAMPRAVFQNLKLSEQFGGGHDPCVALALDVTLTAGEAFETTWLIGVGQSRDDARLLIQRHRAKAFDDVLNEQNLQWKGLTGEVQVKTPEPSFDVMMNGWLLYQTISCRSWARSGFYQASGAFGFRDQLQDGLTLAHVRPDLARAHILKAASRQFVEGDVQHWWLGETGAGVRTHISDDTVWLVYCVCKYIELTQDDSILDEEVSWLEGPEISAEQHDAYFVPKITTHTAPLYAHCIKALARNLPRGVHGLPLMGTGDWNDGMNRVGEKGRGESVWLAWFMTVTLDIFAQVARRRGDEGAAQHALEQRQALAMAVDEQAWDGKWYRRAYFDDGTPLGTDSASECQIDSIAQSWAVLSGAGNAARAEEALQNAASKLVDHEGMVASLFWPPLQQHVPNAGYVQSYPAGVRENGGQYTHGALWMIFALAKLGRGADATRLFQLINPVNHASTPELARLYKVEPYVMAADVYAVAPHRGRGGWTWYTGAAGWCYRAGLEAILGLVREGPMLTINPHVPEEWKTFSVVYGFEGKKLRLNFAKDKDVETSLPKVINLAEAHDGQHYNIAI